MEVIVRENDSFWYFSQLFNLPLPLIIGSNTHLANQLSVGETIQIPGYVVNEYHIKNGDSLWNLSINYTIPIDALYLVNPFILPNNLQLGQTVLIPQRVTDFIVTDVDHYTYEKMVRDIHRLRVVYPFIFKQSIGHSVMGKDLIELQVGTGNKSIHLDGSFHANEWITTPIIMKFVNHYALALTNHSLIRGISMLPLYLDTVLSAVPMVNPDGVNLVIEGAASAGTYESEVIAINKGNENFSNWKANIKGVDLNNQYPALWEIEAQRKPTSPAPRDYPGPHPLSEPESIALADLARNRNFSRINAFHTQGEEIYWGFQGLEPPISEVIVMEYARVSGYKPVRYLDSYAGYKDWFIQEYERPGFTVELGSGVNPLPIGQFAEIYQEGLGIMLANLYL